MKFEILTDKIELAKKYLKQIFDTWVIKGIIKSENQIRFSENNIDISKNWDDIKLILFLSKKRRTTEISISNLSPNVIENTINYCEKLLNVAKINRYYKRLPEGTLKYDMSIQGKIFDDKVANLGEKAIYKSWMICYDFMNLGLLLPGINPSLM